MSKNEIKVPLAPLAPEADRVADRVANFEAFPNSSRVVEAQLVNFNNHLICGYCS